MPSRLTAAALPALAICATILLGAPVRADGPAPAAATVDESALRYYAASRQFARVEAETRRIQRVHPGWQPPKDIWLEELGHGDEEPLWALYAADKLDALQARIDARRRREPGWKPSRNLTEKLERKRLRVAVLDAAGEAKWETVASLAGRIDEAEKDPQLLWAVAEGFARTNHSAEALAAFRRVLSGNPDPALQLATVQKAFAMLPIGAAEEILASVKRDPGATAEIAAVAGDVTRARIAAFLHRERSDPVADEELKPVADSIRLNRDGAGASLLGWYAFARRQNEEALEWFKLAITSGGDAMTAHGLAHTLRRLGHLREAEDVAYAWREPLVQNAILFIDLLEVALTAEKPTRIEPERLERYARVAAETQSGEGAQALAWYATNLCQDEVALAWFERAVAWFPKEATVMGYANSLRRLRRQREFVEVVNRYDGLFPRVVDLLFKVDDRSPSACDAPVKPAQPPSAYLVMDRSSLDARTSGSLVPRPPGDAPAEAPKVRRADFPLPVAAENPRREGRLSEVPRPLPGAAGGWRRDLAERIPLIARRVVGVEAMPYETFGISLLPAYDGSEAPSGSVSFDRVPAGTLWADELANGGSRPAPGRPSAAAVTPGQSGSRFVGRGRPEAQTIAGATP